MNQCSTTTALRMQNEALGVLAVVLEHLVCLTDAPEGFSMSMVRARSVSSRPDDLAGYRCSHRRSSEPSQFMNSAHLSGPAGPRSDFSSEAGVIGSGSRGLVASPATNQKRLAAAGDRWIAAIRESGVHRRLGDRRSVKRPDSGSAADVNRAP
jgi:hypothetical protein